LPYIPSRSAGSNADLDRPRRVADGPAVRGRTEDAPPINRDDRANFEGLRRGEPGQGEESAHLYATGDERGRIGPLSLTSVGEWSVVQVLALE
jgi:hypothetical protein